MSYQQGGSSQIPVRDVRQQEAAERARLAALSRPSHLDKLGKEGARKVPVEMPEEEPVPVPVTQEPSVQQQQPTYQQPTYQQPLQQPVQVQQSVYSRTEPTRPARAGVQQPLQQPQQPLQQPVPAATYTQPVQAATFSQPLTRPTAAAPATQTGQHMRTYARHRHYRYFSSLGSILDPGCEVYTSRGWGYIMKSPDEMGGDKVQVKLQYVEGAMTGAHAAEQNIVELPLNDIEYAAFCGVGTIMFMCNSWSVCSG
jgi:hypothetical protein